MTVTFVPVLPDDVLFARAAWVAGVKAFDRGVTFEQVTAIDASHMKQNWPFEAMLGWRRSYMEGYLAAMRVKAVR